ncbi:MAG TPA: ABC transporter permease [Vicinamibacteria bacterium]|nr:ABC transporter permease [Vicinamibacteria bacterium]
MSIHDVLGDARHSIRMLRSRAGFTLAALAALAVGIGANTAIFSVVNAVLLRPLPYPEPDRLVVFQTTSPQGAFNAGSPAKFQHWREQSSVVEDVAAYRSNVVNYTGGAFPEQLRASQVSAAYFRLFGAPLYLGRTFSADEDRPGGERVAVLSHGLWTRRFGADPAVIGKTISLSGDPYTVVGILGPSFDVAEFGPPPELWIAFQLDPGTNDQGHYFQVAGRLKAGVPLEQAKARLALSAAEYTRKFPNALGPNAGFSVQTLRDAVVGDVRTTLWILLGAVAFVLLIACANVASLLLARATGRQREMAIRAAIGASRERIIRQLLTESVLLSVTGGVLGLVLGILGIRALLAINTAGLPRVGENGSVVGVDGRVLAFTVLVSIGTGVLFGLIPALQASRADLSGALKEGSGRSGTGARQNRTRASLVVVEVALALVLLVGAALLVRTAVALRTVDPGFDTTNVLTMRMSMSGTRYLRSEGVEQAVRDGVERIRALPGVVEASATCCVPLEGGYGLPFVIVGRPLQQGPFHGGGGWLTVSPGYFEVFKMPLKRGRTFNERDTGRSTPVVVINEAMARQFWKKGDPLSDRLVIGRGVMREFADEPERQIVGVVGDVRDGGLNNEPGPTMYIPQAQVPDAANALNVRITPMAWVVRTSMEPNSLSGPIQEALRQATGLPVSEVRTMDQVVTRSVSRERFNMWLMAVFGASALLLAAIGIYGLMAYSVEQRTQEIGIRLALGANASQVKSMVVAQGLRLAVVGVVIGMASALALTRFIASVLYGVEAQDPMVFAAAPAILTLVALLAVWIPARRASRVSPIEALRYE